MWLIFFIAALLAAYRLGQADHTITAGIAAFSALMVFWSTRVVENHAKGSGNYRETGSLGEAVVVAVNFLFSVASLGLLVYSFF